MRVKTAILISGRGTNMESLIRAGEDKNYPASIELVISNRPGVAGLQKAEKWGIKSLCIDHKSFKSRQAFERKMQKALEEAGIELICCAGFMRKLTPKFVGKWPNRLLNIHPSLLPKYKGLNTHQRALEAGDTEHGCSVHFVTDELDSGKVLGQAKIAIKDGDTPERLAERVLAEELKLYPKILRQVAARIAND